MDIKTSDRLAELFDDESADGPVYVTWNIVQQRPA